MTPDHMGRVTTDTVRKLVRLNLLTFRQLDSEHLELTSGEKTVVVDLLTGHWEVPGVPPTSGKGIFSMARYLGLDEQAVLEAWTKASGGR